MRFTRQGDGLRVNFSADDADTFASRWPGSSVDGAGWFEFDGRGNLVDRGGKNADADGPDWLAFSHDCQMAGMEKYPDLKAAWGDRAELRRRNPPDGGDCGTAWDALGAAGAAIGLNLAVGLAATAVTAAASSAPHGSEAERARIVKRGVVAGTAAHSVAMLGLSAAVARRHPFLAGALALIGVTGVGVTVVEVATPAERLVGPPPGPSGTSLAPAGTPAPSLAGSPTPSGTPRVSPGGFLKMPGPATDPLRLSEPRSNVQDVPTVPAVTPTGSTAGRIVTAASLRGPLSPHDIESLRAAWRAVGLDPAAIDAWVRRGVADPKAIERFQAGYNARQAAVVMGRRKGVVCDPRTLRVDGLIGPQTAMAIRCLSEKSSDRSDGGLLPGPVAPAGALPTGAGGAGVAFVRVRSNVRCNIQINGNTISSREARVRLAPGRYEVIVSSPSCGKSAVAYADVTSDYVTQVPIDLYC